MKYRNSSNIEKEYKIDLEANNIDENKSYSYSDVTFTKNNYLRLCNKQPYKKEISKSEFYDMVEFSNDSQDNKSVIFKISSVSEYVNIIMFYRFIYILEELKHLSNTLEDNIISKFVEEKILIYVDCTLFNEINGKIVNGEIKWEDKILAIRNDINNLKSKNITKYNEILDSYSSNSIDIYYRGVGKPIYPEQPGIFRVKDGKYESKMYKDIVIRYPNVFNNFNTIESLTHMQHFELKTRLLDITTNPLVALYMAVNKIYTGDTSQTDYGEVIVYFAESISIKYYDSFKVLINSKLVFLSQDEKESLYNFIEEQIINKKVEEIEEVLWKNDNYNDGVFHDLANIIEITNDVKKAVSSYYKLLRIVRMDYPAFLNRISLKGLMQAYIVNVGYINERISAQAGGFIIFGLDKECLTNTRKYATGIYSNRILKFLPRIIIKDKKKVFFELNALGINDSTMLPDIEHATKYINTKYEL